MCFRLDRRMNFLILLLHCISSCRYLTSSFVTLAGPVHCDDWGSCPHTLREWALLLWGATAQWLPQLSTQCALCVLLHGPPQPQPVWGWQSVCQPAGDLDRQGQWDTLAMRLVRCNPGNTVSVGPYCWTDDNHILYIDHVPYLLVYKLHFVVPIFILKVGVRLILFLSDMPYSRSFQACRPYFLNTLEPLYYAMIGVQVMVQRCKWGSVVRHLRSRCFWRQNSAVANISVKTHVFSANIS